MTPGSLLVRLRCFEVPPSARTCPHATEPHHTQASALLPSLLANGAVVSTLGREGHTMSDHWPAELDYVLAPLVRAESTQGYHHSVTVTGGPVESYPALVGTAFVRREHT